MKKILTVLLALTLTLTSLCGAFAEEENELYYWGRLFRGGMTESETNARNDAFFANGGSKDYPDLDSAKFFRVIYFDDLNSALLALQRGDIREYNDFYPVTAYIAAQNPDIYTAVESKFILGLLSMATLDVNIELRNELNGAIIALKNDGTLAALEEEYLTDLTKLPEPTEISAIEGADTIRVVVTGDMPPFDYVTVDGKAAGYNVALLNAISAKIGKNIELVYASAGSRYISLIADKADAVFWVQGLYYEDTQEIDYSVDVPKGMAMTEAYTIQKHGLLFLKTEE